MSNAPIHPGAVAWTGENPGIYLKDRQDGPGPADDVLPYHLVGAWPRPWCSAA